MLCPLWDPIVFTVVECVLATVYRKVYNYKMLLIGCVETLKHYTMKILSFTVC